MNCNNCFILKKQFLTEEEEEGDEVMLENTDENVNQPVSTPVKQVHLLR